MKIEIKDIIIICLLIVLVYLNIDKIMRIYKNIQKELFTPKKLDVHSDMTHVKKEQKVIQNSIKENITKYVKDKKLKEILFYVLEDGKKVRPIIVTSIYKQLTNSTEIPDYIMDAALAIEYIHTASLIIDDIMDDDNYRRGKEALHYKYNLTIAQLAAVLLFSLGMENIFTALEKINKTDPTNTNKNIPLLIGQMCSVLLTELTKGQYLDIEVPIDIPGIGDMVKNSLQVSRQMKKIQDIIEDMIHKKTSSLFEYSFIIPWVFANHTKTDKELTDGIAKMKSIARQFGLIFQVSDDFEDIEQDAMRDGKNVAMNYVINKNPYDAYKDYKKLVDDFNKAAGEENILTNEIKEIEAYLTKKVEVYYKAHSELQP